MYVVLTFDEYSKLKKASNMLELFVDSLNDELKLKKCDIDLYTRMKKEGVVNKLKQEYSGMLFAKDILNIVMSD